MTVQSDEVFIQRSLTVHVQRKDVSSREVSAQRVVKLPKEIRDEKQIIRGPKRTESRHTAWSHKSQKNRQPEKRGETGAVRTSV